MAVKLMPVAPVAPEITKPAPKVEAEPKQPRKRRRAAVYDADGNEVLITLKCLKCGRMHPLANFGLRKMADGAIRNQPWCRDCRGASSPKKKKGEAELEAAVVAEAQVAPVEAEAPVAQAPVAPAPVPPMAAPVVPYGAPMSVVAPTVEQVLQALAPAAPQAAPAVPAAPEAPEKGE